MIFQRCMFAAAALVAATPVFAAGFETVAAPVPVAPVIVAPPAASTDWSGFYVGGDLTFGSLETEDGTEGDGRLNGVHVGYQRDFGRFVLGGELEHDWGQLEIDGTDTTIDRVARAKLRLGYDAGRFMPYLTAGVARASFSDTFDDADGRFVGLGVVYQINDRFDVGAEVMRHRFDIESAGADDETDVTTIGLRGSIRF